MTNSLNQRRSEIAKGRKRNKGGRFISEYDDGDIPMIQDLLRKNTPEVQIRLGIMKARGVTERTAYRWIQMAKEVENGGQEPYPGRVQSN